MKQLKLFVFSFTLLSLFGSCELCSNIKCNSSNYDAQFRIVSITDGSDLVFGPTKIYDKNQIKFYSLNGTDSTFFEYTTISFPNTGYDSIVYVRFLPGTDIAYMKLSDGDVDTLAISYNTNDSKCCGSVTDITNYRFNNSIDIPGDQGTQSIRK